MKILDGLLRTISGVILGGCPGGFLEGIHGGFLGRIFRGFSGEKNNKI